MTDTEEVHPLRGEEDYVNLDTEQAAEEVEPTHVQVEDSQGSSEEEPHADWEVMQAPLAASMLAPTRLEAEEHPQEEGSSTPDSSEASTVASGEAAGEGVPSSELDSQWQLAGDSDHEHDSGYSDLGSDLDRASSPEPTLDALRLTSQQHGLAASSPSSADSAKATSIPVSDSSASSIQPDLDPEAANTTLAAPSGGESEGSRQEVGALLSSTPDVHIPLGTQPSDGPTMSPATAAAAKSTEDDEAEFAGDEDDAEACWGAESKPRSHGRGPASFTHAALHSAWKWLQDLVSSVRDGLPLPVRHLAAAASRMDRSHLLGAGVAVLGTFLAAAAIRNKQLSHALRDKDRDMAQLVTKVFNLQHTLQSSRNIPIVRHTSSSCSFSFAGGGITGV